MKKIDWNWAYKYDKNEVTRNMLNVSSLDKYIYFCLCAFAFIVCINHTIADQFVGAAALLGLIRLKKECPRVEIPLGYKRALLVFFCIMFVSIFISPDMLKSVKEFWRYANRMIAALLILFFIKEKKRLLSIVCAFLISMVINNLYAVYQGVSLIKQGETYLRVSGFESAVIIFSAYLLIFLPVLAVLLFESKRKTEKKWLLATLILFLIALLFNGTRIAWLIVSFILLSIIFIYIKNLKKILYIICISMAVLGMMVYSLPFMQERLMSFTNDNDISNQGHYYIANDSIEMIKDHPFFGVGLGRFKKVFNEEYRSEVHRELEGGLTSHAHNNILTFWAETGIPGVVAYCFMFGSFLYYSGRQWLRTRGAPSLMFFMITLATVLQGITDFSFGLNQSVKIYFCMLAIYLNYQVYEKNEKYALSVKND